MARTFNVQIRMEDDNSYNGSDDLLEELCDLIMPNSPLDVICVEEILEEEEGT